MNRVEILAVCRHEGILQTIVRLVNNNSEWHAIGAITDDEAITAFDAQPFKLVLLGSGIEKESDEKLRSYFTSKQAGIAIVQHYGGGSGLLAAEIYEALKSMN
jgi:hypothetical protein